MRGSIMPEPLAMPPTRNDPNSVATSTAYSFGNGSVVMIARAAAAPPSVASAETAFGIAGADLVHLEVDADHAGRRDEHVILAAADRRRPSACAISCASTMPCGPVQALAQPLLVTIACARPRLAAR